MSDLTNRNRQRSYHQGIDKDVNDKSMSQEPSQVNYERGNVKITGESSKVTSLMYIDLVAYHLSRIGIIVVSLCRVMKWIL